MKKSIVFLIVFVIANCQLLTFNCKAQPNGGFENWSPEFSFENPDGWETLNFLSLTTPPNPVSAFKVGGIEKHSGNFALKLKTVFISTNPNPALINDSTGIGFTGKISLSPFSYRYGFPYTGRPEKLEFWAKYAPVGNDSASIGVILLRWNGIANDTVASGVKILSSVNEYTLFEVHLNYRLDGLPDSATVALLSSKNNSLTARVGSTLFIDDVALTGWVGINEPELYSGKIQLFPNPAKDNITISSQINEAENIHIVDVLGKQLGIFKIQNQKTNINTSSFAEGVYFYEIRDKSDKILVKNKFSIVK